MTRMAPLTPDVVHQLQDTTSANECAKWPPESKFCTSENPQII